ncbi:MAG: inositol monophosphatase [Chloroflexi bacterium]|nr:inositol monophosphatase [Chloroflexota bacterium]
MQESIDQLWSVAKETAVIAGHLAHQKWSQPRQIREKGFRDFVTDADIATQALITGIIQKTFPHHGFITEEKDNSLPKTGEVLWIIDPVDGTTNYSRQQPIYCVSIAAAKPIFDDQGNMISYKPVVSAIYDPMQDELFHAAHECGAWLNKTQITVSDTDTITYTIVGVDWSYNRTLNCSSRDLLPHFGKKIQGVRCLGSAALALAWVANGRYDGYINCNLKAWDLAAAYVLIKEAGGTVTDIFGNPCQWGDDGFAVLGSNGRIHQDFLDLLPMPLHNA